MNCLIDYIGLKGCGQSDAPSGYYINDLLSDALQQTSKLTTPEKATFLEIWNDVQKRAVRRFGVDVTSFLSRNYRLKRVTQSINLGTNAVSPIFIPVAGEYRGMEINLDPSGGCGNSAMQVIHIQYLNLYFVAAGTITVRFIDGHTFQILNEISVTATSSGWSKVGEEMNFNTTKLLIVYDGSDVSSATFDLPSGAGSCGCDLGCGELYGDCCDASIKGFTATGSPPVFEYGTNTFGLSGIFSVNCSYESFVCNNKNLFTYPLWQLCGYMLMDERIYSSRLNQFTLVNVDGAKERRDKFLEEYNRSMLDVLDGIDLCDDSDCCLECNQQITLQEARM